MVSKTYVEPRALCSAVHRERPGRWGRDEEARRLAVYLQKARQLRRLEKRENQLAVYTSHDTFIQVLEDVVIL
jgi:hypothetical protein